MASSVRIGNGQGFWGDSVDAPIRLLRGGPIDYITMDYLAEVTMSIMQRQKVRNPERGYATDFVRFVDEVFPEVSERGIRIVANAGGVNTQACRDRVLDAARRHGVKDMKIGTVAGDDILNRLQELRDAGEKFTNMETGEGLFDQEREILAANVYMPTDGVVQALDQGAQIVITGRCTDPGLVLAPILHEFKWKGYDAVALGTIAGHILECGAQATGGNFTRWWEVPHMADIGYPIAEVSADGGVVITKHEGRGGLVTVDTVSEQLLYEMGNPTNYITPDCVVDFTSIQIAQDGPNRVRVSGVRGAAPTETLKVSISYLAGYKAVGQLVVSGPDAHAKAKLCAEIVWDRLKMAGVTFDQTHQEFLGVGVVHEGIVAAPEQPPEVVLRLAVKDSNRAKVDRFGKEIAPLVTSGPPGVTGFAGGRPKPQEIVAYWPALMGRDRVTPEVSVVEVGS
ncbi:MAG: DUF1446 domain-containing protein [Thermoanaerobaculales bacterium]|nr:DUF1446 domain-containing protein [Thermoanaerobaculales bacterium]